MTGTGRAPRATVVALLPPAVAACVLVLVWAATTGPVPVFGPGGGGAVPARPTRAAPSATADDAGDLPTYRDLTRDVRPSWDGSWIGELLLYTLLIGLALGALVLLRRLWLHRWRPPRRPAVVGDDVVIGDALASALEEDADAQLGAVAEGGPRDGIVACWLRLEEIAAVAGHAPRPSETSAELVTRLLMDLDLDPRPIGRLAALYREARFSEHILGEDSRAEARSALRSLHDELRARGRVP